MEYGICHLSSIPVYAEKEKLATLVNQVLYGEHFKVLELKKDWCKVRLAYDKQEGWILRSQYFPLTKDEYQQAEDTKPVKFSGDLVSAIEDNHKQIRAITVGSVISNCQLMKHQFNGTELKEDDQSTHLLNFSLYFLNAPEMHGGRTPFGIDSAGLVQLAYRTNGISLPRTAIAQSKFGEALSFIEESKAGDLAFFDDGDGTIYHVGIILGDHRILHVHGKVRIDRLDHTGIFNADTKKYSHSLRVIKKIA